MSPRARGTGTVFRARYRGPAGEWRTTSSFSYQLYDRRKGRTIRKGGFRSEAAAERALRETLSRQDKGLPIGPEIERTTLGDLLGYVTTDYALNRHRTAGSLPGILKHLRLFFGDDARAVDIVESRIAAYAVARLAEGAANATVNRELAMLRRGFILGMHSQHVLRRPHIRLLREDNVRKGFFEPQQYRAVRSNLGDLVLQRLVDVAYVTGWRIPSELHTRQWRHVDLEEGWLRLEPGEDKNRAGRMFPLNYPFEDGTLLDVFRALREETDRVEHKQERVVPWVFHRNGSAHQGLGSPVEGSREGGRPARPATPRLPADGRQEHGAGRDQPVNRHAPRGAQDRVHLPKVRRGDRAGPARCSVQARGLPSKARVTACRRHSAPDVLPSPA